MAPGHPGAIFCDDGVYAFVIKEIVISSIPLPPMPGRVEAHDDQRPNVVLNEYQPSGTIPSILAQIMRETFILKWKSISKF